MLINSACRLFMSFQKNILLSAQDMSGICPIFRLPNMYLRQKNPLIINGWSHVSNHAGSVYFFLAIPHFNSNIIVYSQDKARQPIWRENSSGEKVTAMSSWGQRSSVISVVRSLCKSDQMGNNIYLSYPTFIPHILFQLNSPHGVHNLYPTPLYHTKRLVSMD